MNRFWNIGPYAPDRCARGCAHVLLRAVLALVPTPVRNYRSVHTIVNAARKSACATMYLVPSAMAAVI
jgi:hypothetical protein